ncbi:MAG: hypothetical protein WKG00_36255 [Polyangiaceae bacterium]
MRGAALYQAAAILVCACSSEEIEPAPLPAEAGPPEKPPSVSPPLHGLSGSASLAIDEDALYWFDGDGGFVARRARGGGEPVVLAPATLSANPFVERDHRNLYWVDGSTELFFKSVPVGGGESEVVALGNGGPPGFVSSGAAFALARFAGHGDSAELVELDLAAQRSRVLMRGYFALDMVVRGDDLWATACRPDGVVHVDRRVGVRTALVDDAGCPFTLALQGDTLYYVDFRPDEGSGYDLRSVPVHGEAPSRSLAGVDGVETATDEDAAYAFLGGALVRIPFDGSAPVQLATPSDPRGVAVDETHVFWLEPDATGTLAVQSVPK